jgi:hypothetical protein
MTNKERRARDAALTRLLDTLDEQLYSQVAQAVDFTRLDAIEQGLVAELEQLIAAGQLPPAPSRREIEAQAAVMINRALFELTGDPRRTKHLGEDDRADGDDCELCRMFGSG